MARSEINWDGRTAWVNGPDGMCIARFSRFGAEIHNDVKKQLAGGGECRVCEHGKPDLESWERWVSRCLELLHVAIPTKAKPGFLP